MKFGIHSPLIRGESKYDLVEQNLISPQLAFSRLEEEAVFAKKQGAQYLLVHFPYFKYHVPTDFDSIVENALKNSERYNKDVKSILLLSQNWEVIVIPMRLTLCRKVSIEVFKKYDIKLCIDIGDYAMSFGKDTKSNIEKWFEIIKVVHIHDIMFTDDNYFWYQ